jgi:hypothetical protein
MKTLYMVTSGEYSEYSPIAVFDTEERAEAFIKLADEKSYFNSIETIELNPLSVQIKKGLKPYSIRIKNNGDIRTVEQKYEGLKPYVSFWLNDEWATMYIFAKNKDHAIKIAGEKRTKILASDLWKHSYDNKIKERLDKIMR